MAKFDVEMATHSYNTFRGSVSGVHYAKLTLPADTVTAPAPVLVNLHGGFWKTDWGLTNLPTAELLKAFGDGVATWDVEYARVDQADPASSAAGGGWPHSNLDCLAALNALAELPPAVLSRLDLRRVYLCGHSAGAHLALWLGLVSRLDAPELERLSELIGALAGDAAATAARMGVDHTSISIRGIACLAPVTSLAACCTAGLSDFHDAGLNFLWRLGSASSALNQPNAAASGQMGAACPLALWTELATLCEERADGFIQSPTATASQPPLRLLLSHGLDDVDVPPSLSFALAAAAWSHPQPPPIWLQLLPSCDHYAIAGLGTPLERGEQDAAAAAALAATRRGQPLPPDDVAAAGQPWARVAAALRALMLEEDATLTALCCPSRDQAEALIKKAAPHTCARHTIGLICSRDAKFGEWAAAEPASAAAMARGLRKWYEWVGESCPPDVREWMDARAAGTTPVIGAI